RGRSDGERGPRRRGREEPAAEEEDEAAPLRREAARGEEGDETPADRVEGHQDEAEGREVVGALQLRLRQEERERRPEEAHEDDLAPEEALDVGALVGVANPSRYRHNRPSP